MEAIHRAKHVGVITDRSRYVTVWHCNGRVEMRADGGHAWSFAYRGDPIEWGREVARMLRDEFRWLRGVTFCKEKAAA